MRRLRAAGIGLAGLLGVALLAAWLVPPMLDWGRYRGTIAVLASAVLNRPIGIAGRVSLTLLPEPVLRAAGVSVGGEVGGTARELLLRVGLMPLLGGRVVARELVLRQPDIRVPWPLAPGSLALHRPPWLAAVSARIEDGSLTVGTLRVSGIDATLTAGGEADGTAAAGTARLDGRGWRFTVRATGAGRDDAEGLDASLDGLGPIQGLGAAFSGQLAADGTLSGRVEGRGPDLSQVIPAPAVAFRGAGRLTLAAGLAAADDLALTIGGAPVHGAVTLRVDPQPRLDLALAASRLDLDGWLPVLLRQSDLAWPVGLDLSAEAVQLHGALLRRLRADFAFAPGGGVAVREIAAILPGEASLHLAGMIPAGGAARFAGTASLTAPDLRTHDALARGRRAQAAGGSAARRAAPRRSVGRGDGGRRQSRPARAQRGGSTGRGSAASSGSAWANRAGGRLALAAHLAATPVTLDPWVDPITADGVPTPRPAGRVAGAAGCRSEPDVFGGELAWRATARRAAGRHPGGRARQRA